MVKTANFKELPPNDPDWYFVRAASLARRVYLRGGTGIGAFTKVYGGRRRTRGTKRNCYDRAAKGALRHILQQLENVEIVASDKAGKGAKKGRWITSKGRSELDTIAKEVAASRASASVAAAAE